MNWRHIIIYPYLNNRVKQYNYTHVVFTQIFRFTIFVFLLIIGMHVSRKLFINIKLLSLFFDTITS